MMILMKRRLALFAAAAIALSVPLSVPPAAAFDPAVMDGVVRVKPDWPQAARGVGATGAPRDPEGAGVAVLDGGYIATNVHVLGEAKNVDIVLTDGRVLAAEIVGREAATDIALLKAPVPLPVTPSAAPPGLGRPVCAVGNPFGLGLSVTCGVVSATGRAGTGFNEIEDFIQTDASVNPGGSGGGLFDAEGRFVGLVSAIFTKRSDADIGVNFAASAELVRRVVTDLRDFGAVRRADAGLDVAALPPRLARDGAGVMVSRVAKDGPAFQAGIDAGDVIRRIAGRPVTGPEAFRARLYMQRPGDEIEIAYRRSGTDSTARLVLRQLP